MNQQNNRFLRRLFISYSGLLLIILIMGSYLYSVSIDNVSQEIRTQTKLSLDKSINHMDNIFRTMDVLAGQMVSTSNVLHLANMPNNSSNDFYLKAYYAKEDLSVYVFTESLLPIKASFIHLTNTDYLISYHQFADTELHFISSGSYNRDDYEQWLTMLHDKTLNRDFVNLAPYRRLTTPNYLYKLPLDEYTLKNIAATLCFEFDPEQLEDLFTEVKFYDTGYIAVTDETGRLEFIIGNDAITASDVDQILTLDYEDGLSSLQSGEQEMFVTSSISPTNAWVYYLVQPKDQALYSLTQYRNFFIVIVLAALLAEVSLIVYLSGSNVKKFRQLGTALEDTLAQQEDLEAIVETQKPVIRQSYLRKIIHGNIATELELDYARDYLNINVEDRKFAILYITAYVNQVEIQETNAAITAPLDTNYTSVIRDALERHFHNAHIFSTKDNEYALLIARDDHEVELVSNLAISAAFTDMHNTLNTKYAIWTLAGLGNWNNGLMITWKSYQQAYEAISYSTKRAIFKSYVDIDKDTSSFYYPVELTNQLNNFITTGNSSQVLELFEILRHENMEERSLPIQMMTFLLSDIRNTLYKVRFTIKEQEDNIDALQTIDIMFTQHMSLKLFEDIGVRLCHLFDTTPEANQIIGLIKVYIDDNYSDPSLCLTKISEEFSISESYFSFRFKEETGGNFSSYLQNIRLNHAHELLKETDLSINDICNEVGYNNAHTFRRAFKKIYGLSPKEARIKARS